MNKHSSLKPKPSLLERAAEMYDFGASLHQPSAMPEPAREPAPVRAPVHVERPVARQAPPPPADDFFEMPEPAVDGSDPIMAPAPAPKRVEPVRPVAAAPQPRPQPQPAPSRLRPDATARNRQGTVNRNTLREAGFILPDTPSGPLAEELRIIKRQLLLGVGGKTGIAEAKRQTMLVCSAQPNEGKTFCALNLALSLASEKDREVLLVDGDFAKPEIVQFLGLQAEEGLIEAIADSGCDPEALVIRTDIPGLSILPAGRQAPNATELLSSDRTREVLAGLTAANPRRLVIFDSPPALMASPASVLAAHVGQVIMVVRADQTTEADLREAIGLLSGCENISLLLNGAGIAASGRRFGSYYGYGQ